ncbi:MAG: hypothetical protein RBT65_15655 [Methanolobus sp.]|nr:hypothetical protein [Methanolobus sp.]
MDELIKKINQERKNSVIVVRHSLFTICEFYSRDGKLLLSRKYGNSPMQYKKLLGDLTFYAFHERIALEII